MVELMDLRTGNYIHPSLEGDNTKPDRERYLRILSIDLLNRKVTAKEDQQTGIFTLLSQEIYGCSVEDMKPLVGGFSFNEHSIIIEGEGAVFIIHENGSSIALPHIQYLHQFQNLFRSLTAREFPFNIR